MSGNSEVVPFRPDLYGSNAASKNTRFHVNVWGSMDKVFLKFFEVISMPRCISQLLMSVYGQ